MTTMKTWLRRLGENKTASSAVARALAETQKAGLPASVVREAPLGEVRITGIRFSAAAERVADDPKMKKFFGDWGFHNDADRLQAAFQLLKDLGVPEDPEDVGDELVITGVPPTYQPPPEPSGWPPGQFPKADRVWPEDWAERRIRDIPEIGPYAKGPTEAWPGEHHYKPLPPVDPFGDRSRYPSNRRRRSRQ
jgi:hypothetical protein